ncbi:MAG TPA: prepilin-type N-terminal cleavage/methylation domain-containing protein [Pyrinomonadaceae bacterium]
MIQRTAKIKKQTGFTLVELVVTLVVLSILALGTIPLVQNSVRRQKEQRLRETLREIRQAIDEFHRDAGGACSTPQQMQTAQAGFDPRTRVMISDCKIFEVDNIDRYPPSLETLVEGVNVKPRAGQILHGGQGGIGLGGSNRNITDELQLKDGATDEKKKIYLRSGELPIDPITGKADWQIRSCYQDKDATDWDNINVFDVRSSAEGEALDGTKYSDF